MKPTTRRVCKHCGSPLRTDHGVLIDETGGDVCGVHSVADDVPPNTNQLHETEMKKCV